MANILAPQMHQRNCMWVGFPYQILVFTNLMYQNFEFFIPIACISFISNIKHSFKQVFVFKADLSFIRDIADRVGISICFTRFNNFNLWPDIFANYIFISLYSCYNFDNQNRLIKKNHTIFIIFTNRITRLPHIIAIKVFFMVSILVCFISEV